MKCAYIIYSKYIWWNRDKKANYGKTSAKPSPTEIAH